MDETIKIESIYKEIWEHDNQSKKRTRPYDTKFQKWSFWTIVVSFLLALLIALSTKYIKYEWQKPAGLSLTALAQVAALFYQLSLIYQSVKKLKEPTKHFLEPITVPATQDYKFAVSLGQFELLQLQYALERLKLEITQMKSRISILAGALEKVGIIPVTVTWTFALFDYLAKGKLEFGKIDWIVYGLMGFYIMIIPFLFFIHKLERYALIIKTTINIKRGVIEVAE